METPQAMDERGWIHRWLDVWRGWMFLDEVRVRRWKGRNPMKPPPIFCLARMIVVAITYFGVVGARQRQLICLFSQRHHGAARCYTSFSAIVVLRRWSRATTIEKRLTLTRERGRSKCVL